MGKPVILSVAWVVTNEAAPDAESNRSLRAETFNLNHFGGFITVLAKGDAYNKVVQICGIQRHQTAAGVVPHIIHGTFIKTRQALRRPGRVGSGHIVKT